MRRASLLACGLVSMLAGVLPSRRADAQVYEPNNVSNPPMGLLVPIDSSAGGEVQLYTLFTQQGETIDWRADAHTLPNAFSPLCGFTATFMMNQAGSKFGLAWYNDTGTPPTAADLHEIVPAGTPVGSMVAGATIKSDPNYTGGLVGFALEVPTSEGNHYTNQAYNTVCSDASVCNPAAPWILALMYASTKTPNAYYICFEDGATASNGWGNDGDFNDDVFFLTGITCEGGGQPCDTGMPGICAAGLTQCSGNGMTTCQQLNQPSATETCNGLDDNCDGIVDNGAVCPAGEVCQMGTCVQSCQGGEFSCPHGLVCDKGGFCIDPACANVTCPAGEVCAAGKCKAPCDGITCPYPDVCRVGACVDPCSGVTCQAGQVCNMGVCIASCDCQPCAAGSACDSTSGACVDPTCVGVTCGAGTHCVTGGTCEDDCMGAVCPSGQACKAGACVTEPSTSSSSSSGVVFGMGGSGTSTMSGTGTASANGGATASGSAAGGAASTGGAGGSGASFGTGASRTSGSKGKCSCRVPGEAAKSDGDAGAVALAGLALAFVASTRARRRRA